MNIRNHVRQFLRRYGRAAVVTVHERLDTVEQQSEEIANSHTALLQSNIHLVKTQAQQQTAHEAQLAALRESVDRLEKLHAAITDARVSLESHAYHARATLERLARDTGEFLTNGTVHQVTVETTDYASTNPELGLMSFLYSYLPTSKAIDVGAHVGDVSEYLVHAGFEVFAFEPYAPSYTRLVERLNGRQRFRAFQLALGNADAQVALHVASDSTDDGQFGDASVFNSLAPHSMPKGLAFERSVSVAVRKLADLHSDGALPPDVSLVKIDTEGYDLEVIRGMDSQRYPVVAAEFWDTHIPFATEGLRYTLPSLVGEMRERGYDWYIVLYRVWGKNETGFFCNHDRPVPDSWGNVFFFRDRETFAAAQQWCSAALPRAYFKPVPQTSSTNNSRVNGEVSKQVTDADDFAAHEMRVFSKLSRAGFKPATIFDIGASNGAWSALISRIFPDANFHLFEPLATVVPDYEKGLLWQIQTHPTFTLHAVALGAADQTVTMHLHADGVSSTTLNLPPNPEYQDTHRVPQYRLDTFVKRHQLPLPEVLKLDTQGAERLILGEATTCLKHASVVFAESWFCRGYGPETPLLSELQDLLNDHDYELVELGHRFYDAGHRLYGCDAFFFRRPFAQEMVPLMPGGSW